MPTNLITGVLTLQLVLPAFNDFAKQAELDIALPLDTNQITTIRGQRPASDSLTLIFGERHQFNWHGFTNGKGSIYYVDRKYASSFQHWKNDVPVLATKKSLLTTNEAEAIAVRTLQNLGYDSPQFKLTKPVTVQYFYVPKPGEVLLLPLFVSRWYRKKVPKDLSNYSFQIQVSGLTRKVAEFKPLTLESSVLDLRSFGTNGMTNGSPLPSEKGQR